MPPKKIQRPGCSHDSEPWLKRVDGDPCKAFCEMCQSTFTSEIFAIKRHKSSSHHLSNTSRSSPSLPSTSTSTSTSPTADMATRADIKFMLFFFAGHNIAFSNFDPFTDMLKDAAPDWHISRIYFWKGQRHIMLHKILGKLHKKQSWKTS